MFVGLIWSCKCNFGPGNTQGAKTGLFRSLNTLTFWYLVPDEWENNIGSGDHNPKIETLFPKSSSGG